MTEAGLATSKQKKKENDETENSSSSFSGTTLVRKCSGVLLAPLTQSVPAVEEAREISLSVARCWYCLQRTVKQRAATFIFSQQCACIIYERKAQSFAGGKLRPAIKQSLSAKALTVGGPRANAPQEKAHSSLLIKVAPC